ncbi:MAG: hypothetical protein LBG42_03850 [Treponema sp.]|jgi:hypothetical protein|nr:hypothetical protein [Treponema sp.]
MTCFSGLQAPRTGRNKPYPLEEIIAITIPATIAMVRDREDIAGTAPAGTMSLSAEWSANQRSDAVLNQTFE